MIVVAALTAQPADAKKNDPTILLEFDPQQTVASVAASARGAMLERAVAIRLDDERKVPEKDVLGTRTDDDDRKYTLTAVNDVVAFVGETLDRIAGGWGLTVESGAALTLDVTLIELSILETNQAVGATYNATARLAASLQERGARLWSGSGFGDATRYGRKFSNANVNEVLSDALLEAFGQIVEEPALERAWGGTPRGGAPAASAPLASGAPAAEPLSPDELLAELRTLIEQDFEEQTILEFLEGQVLAAQLSADDLARWKSAGIPQTIIKAALRLPVQRPS